MIPVHCKCEAVLPIEFVKPNPKNPNSHPEDQIKRLAEILTYQGWRHPILVSKRSGFVVAGHGRLLAAKLLNLKEVPVDTQDFESEEEEYTFVVSDNAISEWSELNLSQINHELQNLGPDLNIDLFGIQNFVLEPLDKLPPVEEVEKEKPEYTCENCGFIKKLN